MKLSWKRFEPQPPNGKYGDELLIFCDDKQIHHVRAVDEEAGTVEYLVLNPDTNAPQKFLLTPDGRGVVSEILHGKVEIMLKPNASESARLWFAAMREDEGQTP